MKKKALREMRKEDILKLIGDASKTNTVPKMANETPSPNHGPLLNQLMSMIKPMFQESLNKMTSEIKALQEKLTDLQTKVASASQGSEADPGTDDEGEWLDVHRKKTKKTMSEVLCQSVKNAFNEERIKCDVIISKAEESGDDVNFVSDLCKKMNFPTKPCNPHRLGKKSSEDRPRLLKISFPTAFDARTFVSRYGQFRKENRNEPCLRIRGSKTKEEQAVFSKNSKIAHELNQEARTKKLPESYSLRDNGTIWKFMKGPNDGIWRRDREWQLPSGNDNRTPQPNSSLVAITSEM